MKRIGLKLKGPEGKGIEHTLCGFRQREPMRPEDERARSEFEGILIPVAWDEAGSVTKIALATTAEANLFIDPKGKGKELTTLVRHKVTIFGSVHQEAHESILEVQDYWLG
jgi:hypothetical protein